VAHGFSALKASASCSWASCRSNVSSCFAIFFTGHCVGSAGAAAVSSPMIRAIRLMWAETGAGEALSVCELAEHRRAHPTRCGDMGGARAAAAWTQTGPHTFVAAAACGTGGPRYEAA
jgi:hypothetical protein